MIQLTTNTEYFFNTNIFKSVKAIVEIIYLLSAPLLAYFAYRGLEQIRIAKNNSKLHSKREAFKITAERCEDYQKRIIPLINMSDRKIQDNDVKFIKDSIVTIDNDKIKIVFGENDCKEAIDEILSVINSLEGFSLFFTQGLGNEKVAYESIGLTYIGAVKRYLPFIILYGERKRFKNIIILFNMWYQREEKEKLELEKMKLEEKIKATQTINLKHIGED